jgi:hypothetical protein
MFIYTGIWSHKPNFTKKELSLAEQIR